MSVPESKKSLYQSALDARSRSYSPYSKCKVGAAIVTTEGKVYTGCNVENSSFGGTTCAEQVAIFKGVSEQGPMQLREIMVVTDASPAWSPCGICRQIIAEFAADGGQGLTIHMANLQGEMHSLVFTALYPAAFTPEQMK